MKRRDLEKHLRKHGCELDHHGASHDAWRNPLNGVIDVVPRHKEVQTHTARGICKSLGVPAPPFK